ncbi:MAG: hypothetical protein IJE90_06825 [Clostridia bacterium]|nr:hypothetical protein [Clostridia bacterium]
MKNSLYVTISLVLCAGVLVTVACLRGIKPVDNTPDNSQINDTQTPDDIPKTDDTQKPDDTLTPDDTVIPNDSKKPDDTQKPDNTVADYYALSAQNTKALQAYYAFITGKSTAYSLSDNKEITFVDGITKQDTAPIAKFALVDFGSDGILEVVFEHTNTAHSDAILFYEDGRVYVEYVTYRGILGLTYNGVISRNFNTPEGAISGYSLMTVSVQRGEETTSLGRREYISATDTYTYYLKCDLIDGKTVVREETRVTKDEYEDLFKKIYALYSLEWHTFSTAKIQQVFLDLK